MVDVATLLRLVGGIVLLGTNGYFVTTEFAMTRVRQFSESEFSEGGLRRAWDMTDRLEVYLSGCQLGITISSIGLGIVAEPAVAALVDPLVTALGLSGVVGPSGHAAVSVAVAFGVINLAHVVFGEQVPTYLGIERTKAVARYGAPILYWWTKLMSPFIVLADRLAKRVLLLGGVSITRSWTEGEEADRPTSRGELRRQMGDSLRDAGLSDERQEEVLGAFDIGDIPVSDVMVPREDVVALSTADAPATNWDRIHEHPHVRFPLVGADLSEFHGIVYTPALLRELERQEPEHVDLQAIAAPPMTVSADTAVSDLIDQFQAEGQELALVLRDGEVVGLVTATDAFEAIAGELEDPLDRQ